MKSAFRRYKKFNTKDIKIFVVQKIRILESTRKSLLLFYFICYIYFIYSFDKFSTYIKKTLH